MIRKSLAKLGRALSSNTHARIDRAQTEIAVLQAQLPRNNARWGGYALHPQPHLVALRTA
jgi:hypothetical protein